MLIHSNTGKNVLVGFFEDNSFFTSEKKMILFMDVISDFTIAIRIDSFEKETIWISMCFPTENRHQE